MVLHYSCPGCGAEMTYSIKRGKLYCSHCEREVTLEAAAEEKTPEEEQAGGMDTKEYHCPNCGGMMMAEEKETSALCAYCGAPMILADRFSGQRRPVKILPFRMERKDAEEVFKKWCRKGLFTPRGFMSAQNIQRLKAMYIPYWLFHFDTRLDLDAKATRIRIFRQGNYEVTETEFYDVHRSYELQYGNIPWDASAKLVDEEMAKLEPFNFNELRPFEMPYLAGFESSSYDFDGQELAPAAKEKVCGYVGDYARGVVSGYHTVSLEQKNVDFIREKAELIYVPVWFVDYSYRGEVYKFMMNGQSGQVAGAPPVSRGKVNLWWAGISLILFIFCLIGQFII